MVTYLIQMKHVSWYLDLGRSRKTWRVCDVEPIAH